MMRGLSLPVYHEELDAAMCDFALYERCKFSQGQKLPLPVGAVIFCGMWLLPPSPRWLLLRAAASRTGRTAQQLNVAAEEDGGGADGAEEGGFCEAGFLDLVTPGSVAGAEDYASCYELVLAEASCANKGVFSYGTGGAVARPV